jgi:flagellar motor protein MotB
MTDADDDIDIWPSFVDVLAAAVMFLVLGFVSLAMGQIEAQREKRIREYNAKQDRVERDRMKARAVGEPVMSGLRAALGAIDGADCDQKDWEIECTFKDQLTFDSGRWRLRSEAVRQLLRDFGAALHAEVDRDRIAAIVVEGHTDPVPMAAHGMTNWELSSARAGHIVRLFRDEAGLPGERLQAVGYAEFDPPPGATRHDQMRFVKIRIKLRGSMLASEGRDRSRAEP